MFFTVVLATYTEALEFNAISTPLLANPAISQFSMTRTLPERNRTPLVPVPRPLRERFRKTTTSFGPAFTTIPLLAPARIEARGPWPSIVIAVVIVTDPKSPAPLTSISPPAAVRVRAALKVRHAKLWEHGFESSPSPDTQVREACACMTLVANTRTAKGISLLILLTLSFPFVIDGVLLVQSPSTGPPEEGGPQP